ncbi:MAG: preprotein translocase subunit SecY [Alphaproteobacteria bacterium]
MSTPGEIQQKELSSRIFFVLGALIVYRLGTYIPLPGIDAVALKDIFAQQSGGILGMFDMFSGGALSRMSIFALNIMPYISASIIMQLSTAIFPYMEEVKKEGATGQRKITQWTRYLTVLLALGQGYGMAVGIEGLTTSAGGSAVMDPGMVFRLSTITTLLGGTLFLMWLGEQINQRGIGNGISLIIYAGIVANLPSALASLFELGRTGALSTGFIIFLVVMAVAVIYFIVFMERSVRRITIQYPKRQVGMQIQGGQTTHMPIKLNTSGVIPPIFASSLLLLPLTFTGFVGQDSPEWLQMVSAQLGRGQLGFMVAYGLLIVFFCFFYTSVVFNSKETSENIHKNGAIVPGYRPGEMTAEYFDYVISRVTVIGSAYLLFVCLLPEFLVSKYSVPFYFGGTSLLIVVTVTMDTMVQIQSHMYAKQYANLMAQQQKKQKRFNR